MKTIITIIFVSTLSVNAFALRGGDSGDFDRNFSRKVYKPEVEKKYESEIVKWVGYVESDGGHTTRHDHNLEFVRKTDGESFDIVDSPKLEKVHCDTSKKLLVKIEAEKISRFLYWGGNLIVKNFEVLEEIAQTPHKKYKPRTESHLIDRR